MWPGPRPIPACRVSYDLDPSISLATIHQRHRQTGQIEHRSDSIGRAVFGRPFVKRFALCYQTVLSVYPVLSVTLVYCGQTVGRSKRKLGLQIGLGPGHIALDGDPGPPPQKGHISSPQIFGPCLLRPNACLDHARASHALGMEVGLRPGDIVKWEPRSPS